MKQLVIFFLILSSCFAFAQESKIVSKTKIDWADYGSLYTDESRTLFLDKFKFLENVDMFEFTYLSDGLKIQAFAAIPKSKGPHPVIVYNRGGNRDFGELQLFREKGKYPVAYYFSKMANEGYIVIGCNYRGSGKSEGEEEFGGSDINDVINLLDVVQEIPNADASKMGMYGWSRGGMMTYLALTKTDKIKVAAVGGGLADLTVIDRSLMETNVYAELIPDYWNNKKIELEKRSAVHFADKLPENVPILILHGNADWRVKSEQALKLALELDKCRVPYRLKIFEGGDHGLGDFREDVNFELMSWFDRYLKNGETVPDMRYHGK